MSIPYIDTSHKAKPQKSYEQELEQIYAYYDNHQPKQQECQFQQNGDSLQSDDQYLYEGCDYFAENYAGGVSFEQDQYEGLTNNHKPFSQHTSDRLGRSFMVQHERFKYEENQYNSQPTAINRFQRPKSPSEKQFSAKSSLSSILSSLIKDPPDLTVRALVSAQKYKKRIQKAPSKNPSEHSYSSNISIRSKLLLQQKEKKKNGDKTIEAVFLNPFASLPFEAMDVDSFQKFYKMSHEQILQKVNVLYKKLSILGQKVFFKDKQNQDMLDQLFKLMGKVQNNKGNKSSRKMGKGKSLREFRAIYKYLNMDNLQGSEDKNLHLGQGGNMIDQAYIRQFKELMGYKQSEQQREQSNRGNLYGFGFGKLERKR